MAGLLKGRSALNPNDSRSDNSSKEGYRHDSETQRWSYGVIEKVSYANQVKVRLLTEAGRFGDFIDGGRYMVITNDIQDIALRWGRLRKGMLVRVHWTGETVLQPRRAIAEVIAETAEALLNAEDRQNELKTGPWKIFISGF